MAFPQDWGNRYALIITGSIDGELTDYQIDVDVGYKSGMKSDFGDIRFTSSDGITELKYHLVSKTDSDQARFVVKVPVIATSPSITTVYVYYGNSAATTTSDPVNVYLFYDDFNDGSLNTSKWTWIRESTGNWDEGVTEAGKLNIKTLKAEIYGTANNAPVLRTNQQFMDNFIAECTLKLTPTANYQRGMLIIYTGDNQHIGIGRIYNSQQGGRKLIVQNEINGTVTEYYTSGDVNELKVKISKLGTNYSCYYDIGAGWVLFQTCSNNSISNPYVSLVSQSYLSGGDGLNVFYDDVKVSKYTLNPPSCCPFINVTDNDIKALLSINQEKYTDWLWQNELEITGSVDGQLTNYPVLITVPYDNEFMRTDFQDIRFGTDYGFNLPFFLRRKVDGDYAEFLVKIPVIPASPDTITIYLYAGNDQAPDRSDGYNTFPFFDDFDEKYVAGLDSSKWTLTGNNQTITFSDSILTITQTSSMSYSVLKSIPTFGQNHIVGIRLKKSTLSTLTGSNSAAFGFDNNSNTYILESLSMNESRFRVNDNGTEDTGDDHRASYDYTQYHIYEFQNKPTGKIRESIDFTEVDDSLVTITTPIPVNISQTRSSGITQTINIDYVYVRPSIDNEPIIGALDVWATTTHSDIYQALLNIPYFSDIQTLFCIRPLREDFQALLHITGGGEKLIKAIIQINAANQANYINYVQALLTISANAKNKDIQTLINIGKVLNGSIELKGRILYNYNRDETTIQDESSSKQFVMKLGGRVYS